MCCSYLIRILRRTSDISDHTNGQKRDMKKIGTSHVGNWACVPMNWPPEEEVHILKLHRVLMITRSGLWPGGVYFDCAYHVVEY